MRPWRPNSQSMASYKSSSFAPAMPSTWPSDELAVPARSPRAQASLEDGSITWATTMATTRSRTPRRHRVDQLFEPEAARAPRARRRRGRGAGCG